MSFKRRAKRKRGKTPLDMRVTMQNIKERLEWIESQLEAALDRLRAGQPQAADADLVGDYGTEIREMTQMYPEALQVLHRTADAWEEWRDLAIEMGGKVEGDGEG